MIRIDTIHVSNFEGAIHGIMTMLNAGNLSDSKYDPSGKFIIGPNDMEAAQRLRFAGAERRKFLRQVFVTADITAPLYWWKEFENYKISVTTNAASILNTIGMKEITFDDFSSEHLSVGAKAAFQSLIFWMNHSRNQYLQNKDEESWWDLMQLLPISYNQKRTVTLTYETLIGIYQSRQGHKLDEWRGFCDWIRTLPYSKEFITIESDTAFSLAAEDLLKEKEEQEKKIKEEQEKNMKAAQTSRVAFSMAPAGIKPELKTAPLERPVQPPEQKRPEPASIPKPIPESIPAIDHVSVEAVKDEVKPEVRMEAAPPGKKDEITAPEKEPALIEEEKKELSEDKEIHSKNKDTPPESISPAKNQEEAAEIPEKVEENTVRQEEPVPREANPPASEPADKEEKKELEKEVTPVPEPVPEKKERSQKEAKQANSIGQKAVNSMVSFSARIARRKK